VDKRPGDCITAFTIGPDRVGEVIVRGEKKEEAEELAESLIGQIKIRVKVGEKVWGSDYGRRKEYTS